MMNKHPLSSQCSIQIDPSFCVFFPKKWNWIEIWGPDSTSFLHRLTTVHVKKLQVGQGAPGLFLNPQGRIQVAFYLWKLSDQPDGPCYAFEFESQDEIGSDLVQWVEYYHFGERFEIRRASEKQSPVWLFSASPAFLENALKSDELQSQVWEGNRWQQWPSWDPDWRRWSVWTEDALALKEQLHQTHSSSLMWREEDYEHWRIQRGIPRLGCEILSVRQPLAVGLRASIAPQKGCYPGQEVIEKMLAVGSTPQKLVLLKRAALGFEPGQKLVSSGSAISETTVGEVTSVDPQESSFALAIVRKLEAQEGQVLRSGGGEAQVLRVF